MYKIALFIDLKKDDIYKFLLFKIIMEKGGR
jgi:hypothetical protein